MDKIYFASKTVFGFGIEKKTSRDARLKVIVPASKVDQIYDVDFVYIINVK